MRPKWKALLILGGAVVVMRAVRVEFDHSLDRTDNAWAYAKPSLMGDWQGEAQAGSTHIKMVLTLVRDESGGIAEGDSIDDRRTLNGRAVFSDSTGRTEVYSVAGVVKDRDARKTMVVFSAPPNETPGLRPGRMKLSWDGGPALRGEAELMHAKPGGDTWFSSADPETGHPVAFLFHQAP